jgi:hypothetical protein
MGLYINISSKPLTGKPKALFIFPRDFEKMEYIMGFGIPVLEYISQNYDTIVITGKDSDTTHYKKYAQVWGFGVGHLNRLKDTVLKRADEMDSVDTNWDYNQKIILQDIEECFGKGFFTDLEKIFIIDPIDFILPQTSYVPKKESELLNDRKNEFHDTVNEEPVELSLINKYNKKTAAKYYSRCSVLAFGSHNKNISMATIKHAFNEAREFKMTYAFINDPAFYTPIFKEWEIPFTALYFANDRRGTREFCEFPIGQLQHILWDGRKKKKDLLKIEKPIVKDKDFFFAGTIFQEKGGRIKLYNRYMRDLSIPDSSLFIPQRANGIVYKKKNNDRYVNKLIDKFSDLHNEISNHPLYTGHLVPAEYEEEVKRYRYGLLLRCVSYYDSLNFRPILYARLRILPLIDPMYDPMCLQIPADIQRDLLVNDHKEIESRVQYFNEHSSYREELLDKLEYKFRIKSFEKDWKHILSLYI